MVAHRKNVAPGKAYVPASWVIVLTVMVLIGAAGWLGWLLVDDDSSGGSSPTASAPAATVEPTQPEPTTSEPTEAEPSEAEPSEETPAPEETTSEPTEPEPTQQPVGRTALVSVLNNSGVGGAARAFSGRVAQSGWRVAGIGNWNGSINGNTIYYAPGLQQQAQLLAADVGIGRVMPSVAPMRMDRLTIILSRPR